MDTRGYTQDRQKTRGKLNSQTPKEHGLRAGEKMRSRSRDVGMVGWGENHQPLGSFLGVSVPYLPGGHTCVLLKLKLTLCTDDADRLRS